MFWLSRLIIFLISLLLVPEERTVSIIVLGVAQDAGYPQIACEKECCRKVYEGRINKVFVTSLAIIDNITGEAFLIEASPDITPQLELMKSCRENQKPLPDGIFLTHAHIGHYSGLMQLGKEATNASGIPVYVMPRMKNFLENNGPWSQLVKLKNIVLKPMNANKEVSFSNFSIKPFLVPHRDEYSETVGFEVKGPKKKLLFIPDIDKWSKWEINIVELVSQYDYLFLDATFYDMNEISSSRNISEIPHPFVSESMKIFEGLSLSEKAKIHFIHFNHTNPLLDPMSEESNEVLSAGYKISFTGDRVQI